MKSFQIYQYYISFFIYWLTTVLIFTKRYYTDSIKRFDSNERFVHDPQEGDDTSAILNHGCCNPQKSTEIFLAVRSLYSDSFRVLEQFQHVDAVCGARGCETVRRKAQKKTQGHSVNTCSNSTKEYSIKCLCLNLICTSSCLNCSFAMLLSFIQRIDKANPPIPHKVCKVLNVATGLYSFSSSFFRKPDIQVPYLYIDLGAAVLCASFMSFGVKRRWFALAAAVHLVLSTYVSYMGGQVHYGDWLKVNTGLIFV